MGDLAAAAAHRIWASTQHQQVLAWKESLAWLKSTADSLLADEQTEGWHLCLEYEIPRRSGRIDAVLLAGDLIFVIEFKTAGIDASAVRQVEDYALELLDFHEASQGRRLIPIACGADTPLALGALEDRFGVATASTCSPDDLGPAIRSLYEEHHDNKRASIDATEWLHAPYCPTPTIIEAAQALYAGHEIRELSTSRASAEHLTRSFNAISDVIAETSRRGGHTACFLTGIPGAGKTLAGMNVVHHASSDIQATFLSGNGPLVGVLQEVLATDMARRESITKAAAKRRAETLVTNVHKWLGEYVDRSPDRAPHENVIVFDEAQRAWSREHSMRKFKRDASEPEMMLQVLSRRESAVLIALVGGGQEINTGEAGLAEWGRALSHQFRDWQIAVSPELLAGDSSLAGSCLFPDRQGLDESRIRKESDLHLSVTQRSFRAQAVTDWVEAVLSSQPDKASLLMEELGPYPIVLTRDLDRARTWLRSRARGLRRAGLLASSGARRLRPHGIAVQERVKEVDWFLRPPEDVRSSNFLELALSEFGIQGLEVDWSCVAWGADLTRTQGEWDLRRFRGTTWQAVRSPEDRAYVINRYRVLLTRAREGMALWIPPGSPTDPTRPPTRFNALEAYLLSCGVKTL